MKIIKSLLKVYKLINIYLVIKIENIDINICGLNKCILKSSFGKFLSSQENQNIIGDKKFEVTNKEIFLYIISKK